MRLEGSLVFALSELDVSNSQSRASFLYDGL